ncbi:MAG: ABC transporter substrate-binding protein [Campylobacterota bacterium]|nr:ABC transporter substrate-binding protein [Campylobacterota bacterium]
MFPIVLKFLLLIVLIASSVYAKALEKVSLQLQWYDQFQFAGYYIAKEKGFYKEQGLDVDIKPYTLGDDIVEKVIKDEVQYATGRASLIIDRSQGKSVRLLTPILQASPLVLIAKSSSGIKKIADFKNKNLMLTGTETSASIFSMMASKNIYAKDLNILQNSNKIQSLLHGDADLISAYTSNQVYQLEKQGHAITVFSPKDYGFDFYSDILFTSDNEILKHKQRALKFKKASLKGWQYAFDHIQESVALILKNYNTQNRSKEALIYEANELKKLAFYHTKTLGQLDIHKIQKIYDTYNIMGFIDTKFELEKLLVYDKDIASLKLNEAEKTYLKNKKEIRVCVKKQWLPYEDMQAEKFIGISAEYLKLIADNLNIELKIIAMDKTNIWQKLQKQECDIKPVMSPVAHTLIPYTRSETYIEDSIALVTRLEQPFILDFDTYMHKKFLVVKQHFRLVKFLQERLPSLEVVEVKSIKEALRMVANGEAFGYFGTSLSSAYYIAKDFSAQLKVMNDFKRVDFGFGVANSDPILLNILNKSMKNINPNKKRDILNSWVSTRVQKELDYRLIWQLSIGFTLILIIVIYFLLRQHKLKNKIIVLNDTLEEKVHQQVNALRESEEKFTLIFDIAPVLLGSFDKNGACSLWNKECEKVFGWSIEELNEHDNVMALFYPDPKICADVLDTLFDKPEKVFREWYPITKTGEALVTLWASITLPSGEIISIGYDITQQRKNEIEAQEKSERFFQQSRLAQMGEMISMIAHQWRQPLGAISTTSVNLRMKLLLEAFDFNSKDEIIRAEQYFIKRLENIEGYVQNLTTTIDDFRNFYRPNKTAIYIKLEDVILKSLNIMRASLTHDNIEIIENYNAKESFEVYENELMQVILSLLKNAQDNFKEKKIKYPKITITTQGRSLSVCDNGGGVPEDILANIFDPYFSTKDEKNGTGLGLYMSKTIIEEHHKGSLHVNNTNDGVCFTIDLKTRRAL